MPSLLTFLQKLRKEQRTSSSSSSPPICVTHTHSCHWAALLQGPAAPVAGRTATSGSHESFLCGQNSRPARYPASTGRGEECICDTCVLLQLRETRTTEMPLWNPILLDHFVIIFFFISQPWACGSSYLLCSRLSKNTESSSGKTFCSVFILSLQEMVKAAAK